MSEDKVKVFVLAKKYGFKSADFMTVLRDIGFPVRSIQASVDAWDVPVIEERLLRGGLLDPSRAAAEAAPEKEAAEQDTGWHVVIRAATTVEGPPAAVEAEAEPEVAAEAKAPAPVVETAPVQPPPTPAEAEPVAAAAPPLEALLPEEEPAAAEAETGSPAETVVAEAVLTAPVEPAPAPAAAAAPPAAPSAAAAPEALPKPRPRAGATKVGKIDLAALGIIRSKQEREKKAVTFTDVRDRETERRKQQREKQREKSKERRAGLSEPSKVSTIERKTEVVLDPPVTVKTFSAATGIGVNKILGRLMTMGTMANINAALDDDTVQILAEEFGVAVRVKAEEDIEASLMTEIQAAREAVEDTRLAERPPVIAFLGHVDHGKTSLIDAIRNTKVAAGEAGGITQHLGAYQVTTAAGRRITILDTPGHQAFTAMRARGAKTTDIVVLVVAADDGVMPQTEEAINHARAAGVPIVVAINKIDLPGAKQEQVMSQLAGLGLQPEQWGGTVGMVPVSALRKTGLDTLLERVLLEAEILQLRAHMEGEASGTVLEAKVSEGRGKVADILVQDGTLHTGDVVLSGHTYGKIRLMFNDEGKPIKEAPPATPVELLGLNELPTAGDRFYVVRDLASAKEVAEKRLLHIREQERAERAKLSSTETLFARMEASKTHRVRLIVKADVQGSLEVLRNTLQGLSTEEVTVEIVHSGVGAITETDVNLAETTGAMVIGFNMLPDEKARVAAERAGVEIRRYSVIYELIEDVQKAMAGLLAPEQSEEVRGHVEVRAVFRSSKYGNIAGCFVTDGVVARAHRCRLVRDGKLIYEGQLESLRRLKDDVREVKAGLECGIKLKNYEDIKEGDVIESYEIVHKARELENAAGA
ncbi:MAG: translation initiation factor IF-2 [Planctomycetota bacterium]|nr:MAG: translation initiation factor IF-2 [Planctomycetota bacterium]